MKREVLFIALNETTLTVLAVLRTQRWRTRPLLA